jgi:thioredoxin reductase (NADPH)
MAKECDVVIVGGGPAGLTAGLYAAHARRCAVLIEKEIPGGQIALAALVENYPGFPDGVNGFDLSQAMKAQAEKYGLQVVYSEVMGLTSSGRYHLLHTSDGDYLTKAVILTSGAAHRRLGVPGEERLTGRGVSYCATCDAAFFADQEVAVVGGGDSAVDEGLLVTRYASRVHLIHRRGQLRAAPVLQERAFAEPKMQFIWNTVVTEIVGEDQVTGIRLRNVVTGAESEMSVTGVFVFIGQQPSTDYLSGRLKLDEGGRVFVNEWMETDIPGIFAAGDVRSNAARQVVTAAGDGATAAIRADQYISASFGD